MSQNKAIEVLLVEDNQADVELIRVMLGASQSPVGNFVLSVADSVDAASKRLSSDEFHVVLLDLGLPDSIGIDTLRVFVSDQSLLPVIVLTGLTDEELAVEAVNSGAQDFLLKDDLDARLLRRSIRYSMERHRLEQEQRGLHAELLNVISCEQQRIARELHDEVGQGLAGLNMMARSLARKLRQRDPDDSEQSRMISEGIQDVLDSFRRVLCGLSPVDIDEQGLPVALRRLCETIQHTGVACDFQCDTDFSLRNNSIATHLYRIAQESLTNAMRHAEASQIRVKLIRRETLVVLSVDDDGHGFDRDRIGQEGMGLRILRHRNELIGGSLKIRSDHAGTMVTCEVRSNGSE